MISLPTSGIRAISLWIIVLVSFVGGLFSGFLGGGAGYIRMPSMVYVLGIPTHLAVGTDRLEERVLEDLAVDGYRDAVVQVSAEGGMQLGELLEELLDGRRRELKLGDAPRQLREVTDQDYPRHARPVP